MTNREQIMQGIIQKQDELILRKCKHKPNCYIMQDWSEALDALNNTEIAFRTEDWHIAVADVYEKMQTCTCGLNKLTEDIASLKSHLAEAKEEKKLTDADIEAWADMVQPARGGYKSDYIFSAKAMRDGKIKPR